MDIIKNEFDQFGFAKIQNIIPEEEFEFICTIYDDFLNNKYNLEGHRSDLSGSVKDKKGQEKITQIMRPSIIIEDLLQSKTYAKIVELTRCIFGEDMEIDFDMMINKSPGTATITPWHQDAAYWPEMPDKRALSFWIALDEVDEENGCMCYLPYTHLKPLRHHFQPIENAALQCEVLDEEIHYGKLMSRSAIAHHGYTVHGALGNNSKDRQRRALIVNLRPKDMIDYIRSKGYDHMGKKENKNKI
jgi:ectoine hydroxylase-related dioxygenase (phytanoyl-CoA dioxygenase family)